MDSSDTAPTDSAIDEALDRTFAGVGPCVEWRETDEAPALRIQIPGPCDPTVDG